MSRKAPRFVKSGLCTVHTSATFGVACARTKERARTTFEDVGKLDLTIVKLTVTSSKDK